MLAGLAAFAILCAIGTTGFDICLFKRLTGYQCAGCGLTRGFAAILRLDFAAASAYNPLSIPLFIAFAVTFTAALVDTAANSRLLDHLRRLFYRRVTIVAAVCVYIAVWVIRIIY